MRFIEERLPPLTEVALAASALAELRHGDVALWRSRDNRVRVDYVSTSRDALSKHLPAPTTRSWGRALRPTVELIARGAVNIPR
jgi:hypothetical protein